MVISQASYFRDMIVSEGRASDILSSEVRIRSQLVERWCLGGGIRLRFLLIAFRFSESSGTTDLLRLAVSFWHTSSPFGSSVARAQTHCMVQLAFEFCLGQQVLQIAGDVNAALVEL